ncbi:sugar ABC transporter ATP-binding protein [Salipiger abyssi]|uniref:Ribose transport system ATP-binding protein n=1 Tax=Salipiger abyssi TaxID=1250539 RepID=A0A1P8UWU5_9RHOB|nr:sugar ABC transporter ATP-binding protein [Salipiger abyssi]APZ53863.1 ribose transport system ATP-binding protein [Salipiger abyssi]
MTREIFSARGIGKTYGATVALDNVGFELRPGEIIGLAGMNGAGKSTLLQIIAGAIRPSAGELTIDGHPVQFGSTADALREGIAIVSQELSLFSSLSVEENLRMLKGQRSWPSRSAFRKEARKILSELGFDYDLGRRLEGLSLGERQLVEIARALLQSPRVLILDEPTSSLHTSEVKRLHDQLRRLRDLGVGIVYVTHFLEDLIDVCDEAVVLRNGQRVASPDLKDPDSLPALVAAMLGDDPLADPETEDESDHALEGYSFPEGGPLVISDLRGTSGFAVEALEVKAGEVYGVSGLVGSGVSDLFEILFGVQKPAAGRVRLPSGASMQPDPAAAVKAGVAYLPADRKALSLMQRQSIAENVVSVRSLAQGRDGIVLDRAQTVALAQKRCAQLGVKLATVEQTVSELSGGNQQKVVFAKWLEAQPTLLLLDDPTRGIDIHARLEIHRIVRHLAQAGLVVLVYSSDPGEIIDLADRIGVFVDGRLAGELSGAEMTEHNLLVMMNSTKDAGAVSGPGLPRKLEAEGLS